MRVQPPSCSVADSVGWPRASRLRGGPRAAVEAGSAFIDIGAITEVCGSRKPSVLRVSVEIIRVRVAAQRSRPDGGV